MHKNKTLRDLLATFVLSAMVLSAYFASDASPWAAAVIILIIMGGGAIIARKEAERECDSGCVASRTAR